ncbi:ubiquitin thioesterase OTUB1-like isoform X2 [Paramacrobiotus metropolitanus]|nr:ubiquitin thioesterase OTUB1-like isoform X2 [Paramacrobiotus metropolitanus]
MPVEGTLPKKIKVDSEPEGSSQNGIEDKVAYGEADSSSEYYTAHMSSGPERSELPAEPADLTGAVDVRDGPADEEPSTSAGSRGEPLQALLDFVEPQYVDERTQQQMLSIENEIKEHVPFVSVKESLDILEEEYSDPVYIQKIANLQMKYEWLRRTRGDGNCFYRCLGFSLFENVMLSGDQEKAERLKALMVECKDRILKFNYPKLTMEDFLDNFNDQLTRLMETPTEEELLDIFNNQGCSDFIVVWLRFLTVLQLRSDPEFYGNFIENHANVEDFCRAEVEVMFRESDHIHIIAVASLLSVKIRVEYMDRGGSSSVIAHDFPETEAEPEIFMLYRPGHYDILYKKGT